MKTEKEIKKGLEEVEKEIIDKEWNNKTIINLYGIKKALKWVLDEGVLLEDMHHI